MDGTLQEKRWWERTPARLSLRASMLVVLALACGLGWLANSARAQREAIRAIEQAGGKAFYGWQLKCLATPDYEDLSSNNPGAKPRWPQWFVDWVPPDYYSTVKLVMIIGEADPVMPHVGRLRHLEEIDFVPGVKGNGLVMGPTDAGMVHLRGLTGLRHLNLSVGTFSGAVGSKITGKGLAEISGATRLQILQLQGSPLTDLDLAPLEGMTDLRVLSIESPGVTDEGLKHLAGLSELRNLGLANTSVTAEGIKHLRGLTRLHVLNLSRTRVESLETCRPLDSLQALMLTQAPVGDDGLATPSGSSPGFAGLTVLMLPDTRVGDPGLMHLRDLPKLKTINVIGSAVTDEGVAEFNQARPGVTVIRKPRAASPRSPNASASAPAGK